MILYNMRRKMKLFVYGTLREGEYNHIFVENSKFIKNVYTKPEWVFYDLGGFPAACDGGSTAIFGELYEVTKDTLNKIDILESHPEFYVRRKILLETGEEVYSYILRDAHCNGCRVIKSGDWKNKK